MQLKRAISKRIVKVFTSSKSKAKARTQSQSSQVSTVPSTPKSAAHPEPKPSVVVVESDVVEKVDEKVQASEPEKALVADVPAVTAEPRPAESPAEPKAEVTQSESTPAKPDVVADIVPTPAEAPKEASAEEGESEFEPGYVESQNGGEHVTEACDSPNAETSEPESEAARPPSPQLPLDASYVAVTASDAEVDDLHLASSLTIVDLSASKDNMGPLPPKDVDESAAEEAAAEEPTNPSLALPANAVASSSSSISIVDPAAAIDPFVVDDPEEPLSDPEPVALSSPAKVSVSLAENDVPSLVHSSTPGGSVASSEALPKTPTTPRPHSASADLPPIPVDTKKDVPPAPSPPPASDSSSDEEAPELHTPGLVLPTLFLPIPNTDPLTTLLIKHVPEPHLRPPRDLSGEWQHADFNTLVMTNNWRALARMARDRIVTASPSEVELILNLWYVRLSSLARLRLFNQTSAECENLFAVLANIEPPTSRAYLFNNILPFELEVMRARCAYWAGDNIGYLDDLSALLRRCKARARKAKDQGEAAMWKERGARMCLIIASQLVELKDYTAATSLLEPLCSGSSQSPALRSAIARIYLQGGYIAMATYHFSTVDADPDADPSTKDLNALVLAAANSDWPTAVERARALTAREPDNIIAINNYAVALLSLGRLKEGIQILETVLQTSPSAVTTAEPYLFNLSTLYELRSSLTANKKRDLLIEVAKWSGDGLKTTCLKMPS